MKTALTLGLFLAVSATAQAPDEAAVLGGPCLAEDRNVWHRSVSAYGEAERSGDLVGAADIARAIVRGRCSNEHWWLKLAETLVRADRPSEAVEALTAYYARGSNGVDRRLRDPESPLHALLESSAYLGSDLAASIERDREALEERRARGRELLAAEKRPIEHFIAKDACPFECCTYGTWSVTKDVALCNSPGGFSTVAELKAGQMVKALTGEVRLRPLPAIVRYPTPYGLELQEGALVYILDYMGEGHGRVLANGKVGESHILSVHEHCAFPSPDCWAEFVNPEDAGRQREFDWWIQIETPDSRIGWTDQPDSFGGKDACS